ncbi:hypothetical protein F5888DRAFT_229797 [Russula emetica]|nr:hypothetical protein F5888DRAFT_229797 [Russula emetica]
MLQKGIMGKARIQRLLIALDDELGGVEMPEGYQWHDRYTYSPTRRISPILARGSCRSGASRRERLEAGTKDSKVAGFKSVACLRPELDVSAVPWWIFAASMSCTAPSGNGPTPNFWTPPWASRPPTVLFLSLPIMLLFPCLSTTHHYTIDSRVTLRCTSPCTRHNSKRDGHYTLTYSASITLSHSFFLMDDASHLLTVIVTLPGACSTIDK